MTDITLSTVEFDVLAEYDAYSDLNISAIHELEDLCTSDLAGMEILSTRNLSKWLTKIKPNAFDYASLDFTRSALSLDNLLSIGDKAFQGAIVSAIYAPKLESIGDEAFVGGGVYSMDLSRVKHFGADSFANADVFNGRLDLSQLSGGVTIGNYAFSYSNVGGCVKLPALDWSNSGSWMFYYSGYSTSDITRIEVGSSPADSIEARLGVDSRFVEIITPNTVLVPSFTEISGSGRYAVRTRHNATGLKSIPAGRPNFTYEPIEVEYAGEMITAYRRTMNGITYGKISCDDGTVLNVNDIEYANAVEDAASLTSIGDYAFAYSTKLRGVSLHNIKHIGKGAFEGCTNLQQVDLWGVESIGDEAFSGCSALYEVNLHNCSVGDEAAYKKWGLNGKVSSYRVVCLGMDIGYMAMVAQLDASTSKVSAWNWECVYDWMCPCKPPSDY